MLERAKPPKKAEIGVDANSMRLLRWGTTMKPKTRENLNFIMHKKPPVKQYCNAPTPKKTTSQRTNRNYIFALPSMVQHRQTSQGILSL